MLVFARHARKAAKSIMAHKPPVPLDKLRKFPTMTRWFSPPLLAKLLLRVIVSNMFGQYADRRLIVAALDTVSEDEQLKRARSLKLGKDSEGSVWFDFVADLGDGFDATYAIASLLGRQTLEVGGNKLPRGQFLVMGGDEVYPLASNKAYRDRLRAPYDWAFPDHDPKSPEGTPVAAIPGNHDWYDGLMIFLALFAREEKLHLGSWRTCQRRSYFAFELTEKWWIWCLDTQLDDDIDQPQKEYFSQIVRKMPDEARIILCGPEPGWLYGDLSDEEDVDPDNKLKSDAALEILDYAVGIATHATNESGANKRITIPVVLSGDTHHYSRYYAKDCNTHFITSGGGGAFLHPTHQCDDVVELRWLGRKVSLSLKTEPGPEHKPTTTAACYPSRQQSKWMLWQDAFFAFKNFDFALVLGIAYSLFATLIAVRDHPGAKILTAATWIAGMFFYFAYQQKKRLDVKIASVIHGVLHFGAIWFLAVWFLKFNELWVSLSGYPWLALFAAETVIAGAFVGGAIFGLYLMITCFFFGMNYNDAYSAMRRDSHRHFLRIRINSDQLTVYPIALDKVPKRRKWQINPNWHAGNSAEPAYLPERPFKPRLIEDPIAVQA